MQKYCQRIIKAVKIAGSTFVAAPSVLLLRLVRPVIRFRLGALDIGRLGGSFGLFAKLHQIG